MIDNQELSWNESVTLTVGREYQLTLQARRDGDNDLLGFLLRLGGGSQDLDTTTAFVDIANNETTQYAAVCTDVGGLCHTHNNPKTAVVGGTLQLDAAAEDGLPLDVTVVTRNCGIQSPMVQGDKDTVNFCSPDESIYFHTVYNLTFVSSATSLLPTILFVGASTLLTTYRMMFL